MSDANIIMLVFFLYVSAMIGIGVFFMNKNDTIGDYILGGRSLNPWVAAMSAQASDMSGWLLTGLAFLSAAGTKEAVWTAIGLGVGTFAVYELCYGESDEPYRVRCEKMLAKLFARDTKSEFYC